jgi:hypothetical protein
LFVLPGTAMRERAAEDGLIYKPDPPYRVIRTATMSEEQIAQALSAAEERLGRRLDARLRPHLVEHGLGGALSDRFCLDLDRASTTERDQAARPGAQHCALWFEGEDLFARRAELVRAIEARQAVDPYATLDVVLVARQPFPLDLLDLVRGRLEAAAPSYSTRSLRHRGDGSTRITVVLERSSELPLDWVEAVRDEVQVFQDQSLQQAAANAAKLGDELPAARIIGPASEGHEFKELEALADPECVVFGERALETIWQRRVLGYGDAGS